VDENKGNTVLVEGPNEFYVKEGAVSIYGCPVDTLTIPDGKVLPLYVEEDAKIELSHLGHVIPIKGNSIPEEWSELSQKISQGEYRKIMFIGHSDTGKSSCITYLANMCETQAAVLDCDIGQADISYPASISLSVVDSKIPSLEYLSPFDSYFVGKTSPAKIELRCLRGIAKLIRKAEKIAEVVFIDTTGWIYGIGAREYKLAKINVVNPDLIVCMNRDVYYLEGFEKVVLPSFVVKKRDKVERAEYREQKFKKSLNGGRTITIHLDTVTVRNSMLFCGEELTQEETESLKKLIGIDILYGEKSDDFIIMLTDEPINFREIFQELKTVKSLFEVADVRIYAIDQLKYLLLGLRGENHIGIGVITGLDPMKKELEIYTPVPEDDIKVVEFGLMKVNEEGKELGFMEYY